MTNLLYSAKHYQTKCAEDRKIVEDLKNDAEILLKNAQSVAKSTVNGNIGDIRYTLRTEVPNGGFWCDGSLIQQNDLPTIYDMLLQQKLHSVDINTYNNVVNLNGSCGFFGLDTVNKSFKLPLLQDVYIKAGQEADEFGAESLPNITGQFNGGQNELGISSASGAFAGQNTNGNMGTTGNAYNRSSYTGATFNASRSSPTYQDGAKVNPDHVKYRAYIILYSAEKEMSIVNWTNQLEKKTNEGIAQIDAKADSYLDKTQITNCITEIPQDIKLELVDDRLVLKSGSKIRIPNGKNSDDSLKFDEFVIETDISCTFDNTNQKMVFLHPGKTALWHCNVSSQQFSGDTQPTISWGFWYDTKNNIIKHTKNGSDWTTGFSLPLCLATGNDSSVTSIDQVFNGFSYIGSTVFALPGVKGLIPDGRNADGSLRNIEFITSQVKINNPYSDDVKYCGINKKGAPFFIDSYHYDNITNTNIQYNTKWEVCVISGMNVSNGKITSFNPKSPFRAVDYNDKKEITAWGMPDYSATITITTNYNCPTNGWGIGFAESTWGSSSSSGFVYVNGVKVFNNTHTQGGTGKGHTNTAMFPCKKGDVITFVGATVQFCPCIGG